MTLTALEFVGKVWPSNRAPALFRCDDGREYVVKGERAGEGPMGRALFAELVVAHLAAALSASVPAGVVVDLPPDLLEAHVETRGMVPGLAFGSLYVAGLHGVESLPESALATDEAMRLGLLFAWTRTLDPETHLDGAGRVWALDHERSFPGWHADFPQVLERVSIPAPFHVPPPGSAVLEALAAVTDETIATAVHAAPESWGPTDAERLELAAYLSRCRDVMCAGRITGHDPVSYGTLRQRYATLVPGSQRALPRNYSDNQC